MKISAHKFFGTYEVGLRKVQFICLGHIYFFRDFNKDQAPIDQL